MVFDIASELSSITDLSRTIPDSTLSLMAFAGAAILCTCAVLLILIKRNFGLRFMPVVYGISVYFLFCYFIGSLLSNVVQVICLSGGSTSTRLVIAKALSLVCSIATLVLGRVFAQWFIRKLYAEYCDFFGIGYGLAITEGLIAGIILFFNYVLCLTINANGLTEYLNSYETVELATEQLLALETIFDTPAYYYLLLGISSILKLVFHVASSVMFFAIANKNISKWHILSLMGLTYALYFPEALFSIDVMTNMLINTIIQITVFAGSMYLFVRMHKKYFGNIKPVLSASQIKRMGGKGGSTKMPEFNKNVKN